MKGITTAIREKIAAHGLSTIIVAKRLGIEQGLTNIWQDAPHRSSLRTTTSWLSLGYTLF